MTHRGKINWFPFSTERHNGPANNSVQVPTTRRGELESSVCLHEASWRTESELASDGASCRKRTPMVGSTTRRGKPEPFAWPYYSLWVSELIALVDPLRVVEDGIKLIGLRRVARLHDVPRRLHYKVQNYA